jgi:hypothetical protein
MSSTPASSVMEWLLDSDPSIRWQVMRDLQHAPADVVAAERSRVATEGWGAQLLDLQLPDGRWGGDPGFPHWSSTNHALTLLRVLGADPAHERMRAAIALVRDKVTWGPEFDDSPFFEGETEACINGRALAIGAYVGDGSDRLVARLVREQLSDGGWNCYAPPSVRSSFASTLCVLDGLWEYEVATGPTAAVTAARRRGEAYLLDREMFRSLSTGAVVKAEWLQFSFPSRWQYDVLCGLDYLRRADVTPDARIASAIELVESKRASDGRWALENPHATEGYFAMEVGAGTASRWNTLRALRVLKWYHAPDRNGSSAER